MEIPSVSATYFAAVKSLHGSGSPPRNPLEKAVSEGEWGGFSPGGDEGPGDGKPIPRTPSHTTNSTDGADGKEEGEGSSGAASDRREGEEN